jgi:penicillin amidase
MDYFKKLAVGRQAEFLGSDGIRSDFLMRLLGLREKAESLYNAMNDEQKAPFQAYAHGVRVGMKEALKHPSYEFQVTGGQPEPWEPEDSITLILLESFDQTRRSFENQIREAQWQGQSRPNQQPHDLAQWLSSRDLPWDISILKAGEYSRAIPVEAPRGQSSDGRQSMLELSGKVAHSPDPWVSRGADLALIQRWFDFRGIWSGAGAGSNDWVIAGKRSASGHALLANDPHLSLTHPPFWYWVHLNAGDLDVIGATFPGIPFVAMGTSRTLSWGLTNAFLPVSRLSRVQESELKEAKTVRPWIWVKLWKLRWPFFFKTYRRTLRGNPILPLPAPEAQAIVLRWTSYDLKPEDIMGLFELPRMKSVQEADRVLGTVKLPTWNVVFADGHGEIGYRAVGRVPRFKQLPAFGIPLETLAEIEDSKAFADPLTADEMPHLVQPERGWISTANNRQWPMDSAWSAGDAQHLGFRALRIEELLVQESKHDVESNKKIQCDVQAVDARFLLPELMPILVADAHQMSAAAQSAVETLKAWQSQGHFEATTECSACAIYRRWMDRVLEKQNSNLNALYRGLKQVPMNQRLKENLVQEFFQALADLHLDTSTQRRSWGEVHTNSFDHLLGKQWFMAKPIATPGDEFSVNPGTSVWQEGLYHQTAGASQRMIVEMSQPPQVYSVVAGPQADIEHRNLEDPGSEWQKWVHCQQNKRLFPLDWTQVTEGLTEIQL